MFREACPACHAEAARAGSKVERLNMTNCGERDARDNCETVAIGI
jgi:hypothetical protein